MTGNNFRPPAATRQSQITETAQLCGSSALVEAAPCGSGALDAMAGNACPKAQSIAPRAGLPQQSGQAQPVPKAQEVGPPTKKQKSPTGLWVLGKQNKPKQKREP